MAFLARPSRPRSAVLAALLAVLAALTLTVAPAAAKVVEVGSTKVGLQPRSTVLDEGYKGSTFENAEARPVVSSSKVYAIYWDPEDLYHGNWQQIINGFFFDLSEASGSLADVFDVDTQYTDAAGQHAASQTAFEGAYTDTDAYPANTEAYPAGCKDPDPLVEGEVTCLSAQQIEEELERFIADHSLPKGMSAIYYVLTPPGVTDCLSEGHCSDYKGNVGEESYEHSFCSYHSAINPGSPPEGGAETVLYAAIPWTAGGLGDYHLAPADRKAAVECQDGGWEPVVEGAEGEVETPESSATEQQPNQSGVGPDGSYDAGLADLIVGQIANEQQDIVTDPLLNAWQTQPAVAGEEAGEEVTDLCRDFFAPALGGSSGVESAEEEAARELEEKELAAKYEKEIGLSKEAAEEEAKRFAQKKAHHGEPHTEAGTLYDDELNGGHYYLNNAFNLASVKLAYPGVPCLKGVSLVPAFTAPARVNAGEIVGFDGMESNITLDAGTVYAEGVAKATYPVYEWNFGDGATVKGYAPGAPSKNSPETTPCEALWLSPCAGSAYHTYTYGGTYDVTLTVTDVGGNVASIAEPIVVSGPAPPALPGVSPEALVSPPVRSTPEVKVGEPKTGESKAKSGTTTKTSKTGKSETPLTSPKLTALVVTKSPKALAKGLKVRYSVNEQAAGRFEVLVAKSLATHLHLQGAAATDLPKGSKPQTVIAHALLVTTRSARRTIEIEIPKKSAARLAKLHDVTLTLRVSARDASASDPQVSILQTVAKLAG